LQSLKSDALEPTRAELVNLPTRERLHRMLPVYGLLILAILLILLFSLLFPDTFPTMLNFSSMIDNKSITALLSFAVLCPMITGKIDLTIGYGIVLWHIMAISLQLQFGMPWPVACLIVIALGGLLGLINGLLVEVAVIDSFIATLGTGTVLYSIALWYTGGRQVVGDLPEAFYDISALSVFGIPISAVYVIGLGVVLWAVFEHMPIGRQLYAIGAN
jgi:ribose transport system permease protein